jgi:hypothetical protein
LIRAAIVSVSNSAGRLASAVWSSTRTIVVAVSVSVSNAAARFASAGRVAQYARSAASSVSNAAGRFAGAALGTIYKLAASVSVSSAAFRHAVATRQMNYFRPAAVTVSNAALRFATAAKGFLQSVGMRTLMLCTNAVQTVSTLLRSAIAILRTNEQNETYAATNQTRTIKADSNNNPTIAI